MKISLRMHSSKDGFNQGFTLIELLVVIAIIGLLAGVVTLRASSARAKSRDAKRKADIGQFRKSLELYFNDFASYPLPTGGSNTEVYLSDATLASAVTAYLGQLPRDPSCLPSGPCSGTPEDYKYITSSDQQNYAVLVSFANDGNLPTCKVMTPGGDLTWFGGAQVCDF